MAKEYLDKSGLTYFWSKIKEKFAPKASPAFTGTPTAPTAAAGTNTTQIATTAFVQTAVSAAGGGVTMQTSSYTATASVSTIPIGISGFDASKDALLVFINGLFALGKYTVSGTNIVLTNAIAAGNEVYFVVFKG